MKYEFDSDEDLIEFVAGNVVTTREAMDMLGCSRQNIDDLIKRGKLIPVKKWDRDKLFWKADIVNRMKPI